MTDKKQYLLFLILFSLLFTSCGLLRHENKKGPSADKKVPPDQYNSCANPPQSEPLPLWFTDMLNLKSQSKRYAKLMTIKNFDVNRVFAVSSKAKANEMKAVATVQDATDLAWEKARKRMFDSYIDEFNAAISRGGSSVIDKVSLESSFYQFVTKSDVSGISPLTVLKQQFTIDVCPDDKGYNCYMMAYLRFDEFEKRMKALTASLNKEPPNKDEEFELWFRKWLNEKHFKEDAIPTKISELLPSNAEYIEADKTNSEIKAKLQAPGKSELLPADYHEIITFLENLGSEITSLKKSLSDLKTSMVIISDNPEIDLLKRKVEAYEKDYKNYESLIPKPKIESEQINSDSLNKNFNASENNFPEDLKSEDFKDKRGKELIVVPNSKPTIRTVKDNKKSGVSFPEDIKADSLRRKRNQEIQIK